jgi:hypothetical protein
MKKTGRKKYNVRTLFNVAYYTAKNNKPFSDFSALLELTVKSGVGLRQYNNEK